MNFKEKRRFLRHLLVNPLEFRVSEDSPPEKTETVNVSEGGLLFTSKTPVGSGKLITLMLPLYDKIFKIKARVMHSNPDESTGLYHIGVAFEKYADAFKVKLIEQIYLIEEYRVLRSLQAGREISLKEASLEWIERYSRQFEKLYW